MTIKYAITAIDTKQGDVKDLIREEYGYVKKFLYKMPEEKKEVLLAKAILCYRVASDVFSEDEEIGPYVKDFGILLGKLERTFSKKYKRRID